ncbi:MAG: redox-active disulfide protein 2 [Bacteroidetes bacterium 24-39-8]|jgi:small redox-active disulfide protein 2|nr:MAG: redox-active disulfide protein 2 [Sphingobacteriia bacterium 35-40-8]OYZ51990.1 MAG: redox-active disulfide protein 2 [Bacteroidetes bacterium 24-39-8]OZA66555.1 MAG: redox-active disulfide protein 2 [Sphingobacteriia bacterium 39-39-8]HQR91838.1 thioredoxin family protein [Sediminibacterium sp.]HQS56286.1 thioredoxin family protein [Sediminibacterium sp.]
MKLDIKVLGPGCVKCTTTYQNVITALAETGIEATLTKIEDLEEMMQYNVLTTPVLMINGVAKIKGRIADVKEIKELISK